MINAGIPIVIWRRGVMVIYGAYAGTARVAPSARAASRSASTYSQLSTISYNLLAPRPTCPRDMFLPPSLIH